MPTIGRRIRQRSPRQGGGYTGRPFAPPWGPPVADTLHRFMFENGSARGVLVQLESSWQEVLARHHYPPPVRDLLGQLLVAAALLGNNLKAAGRVIVELRGDGPLRLLVADNRAGYAVRALARWSEPLRGDEWHELLGSGRLVITLDPRGDGQRYQGIVALLPEGLTATLEDYFSSSEQLPGRIVLATDGRRAAGLLLQRLPGQTDPHNWEYLALLAATARARELLELSPEQVIGRLFADQEVRLLATQAVEFACSCSVARVESTLRALGRAEIESLLEERGAIDVDCEFCNQHYHFDRAGVDGLLDNMASGLIH
ncbi:MAG: Hsp33 family molecular chaperone HslO [Immundisolibacter sp.]|uniref:Hsp33 family molecular chaperone HslO n=1 Tax=Immundisolibacter sp. TaxID=1934948 RepID=UPI003EE00CBE